MGHIKKSWLVSLPFILLGGVIAVYAVIVSSPTPAHADPFAACNTDGILFQYPNGTDTQVHQIDMVSGADSYDTDPISIDGRTINAIGYNVLDNFVYGWDNTADTLVRIHSDFSTVEEITINGAPAITDNVIIGDVDENGHFWFIVGSGENGHDYYGVDLTSGDTTVDLVPGIGTGTLSGVPAGNNAGADWAFVPGGTGLYRIMHDTGANQGRLLVFDRSSGAFSDLGLVDGLPSTDLKEGAFYADADGFLYASDNDDGNIYRVNINTQEADLFSTGPSADANDGARCANAAIPIDFSDAPSSYGTLLSDTPPDGGARHSVAGYNGGTNTAPLMLGKLIDIETDGFPGPQADGDDLNNIDDEEGVTHIVATPGTPTALSIPVTVTNNTSDIATLAGWVDLDDNGTFDAGERVMQSIPANSGTATYEMEFPETTFTDNSFARFRLFDPAVADPQPTGSATGGEVEDYLVQVGTYEVEKTSDPADGSVVSPGDEVTYTLDITNTGLTDLINLTLHDELVDVLDDATLTGTPVVDPASAGSAVVDDDELQFIFTGDILAGQSVTVTYSVTVNDPDTGDGVLRNMIVATHSNCHPQFDGQDVSVADPDCQTEHTVSTPTSANGGGGLADTGVNYVLVVALGTGLVIVASSVYVWRKQLFV